MNKTLKPRESEHLFFCFIVFQIKTLVFSTKLMLTGINKINDLSIKTHRIQRKIRIIHPNKGNLLDIRAEKRARTRLGSGPDAGERKRRESSEEELRAEDMEWVQVYLHLSFRFKIINKQSCLIKF